MLSEDEITPLVGVTDLTTLPVYDIEVLATTITALNLRGNYEWITLHRKLVDGDPLLQVLNRLMIVSDVANDVANYSPYGIDNYFELICKYDAVTVFIYYLNTGQHINTSTVTKYNPPQIITYIKHSSIKKICMNDDIDRFSEQLDNWIVEGYGSVINKYVLRYQPAQIVAMLQEV